jgi:hypothetical protein
MLNGSGFSSARPLTYSNEISPPPPPVTPRRRRRPRRPCAGTPRASSRRDELDGARGVGRRGVCNAGEVDLGLAAGRSSTAACERRRPKQTGRGGSPGCGGRLVGVRRAAVRRRRRTSGRAGDGGAGARGNDVRRRAVVRERAGGPTTVARVCGRAGDGRAAAGVRRRACDGGGAGATEFESGRTR